MKAIAYVRVSTEEQADSGLGLEAQRQRIAAYCQMRGLELVELFEDAGISGGKPLASRPAGKRFLGAVRRGSAVVVLKLDRAFRNAGDCLATVEQWNKQSVSLHIVDLGGNAADTSSAAGKFMLTVLAGAAEMERNLTRERTRSAMAVKRDRGERVSRFAPFGWDFGPDGSLIENPHEQAIISDIRRLRATGMTYKAIGSYLEAQNVPTKQGKTTWTQSAIKRTIDRQAA